MSIEIIITQEYNNVKPNNFLKKKIDLPFYKIAKLIQNKRITLNKKKIKKESILKTGDIIKIWPNDINLRKEEVKKVKPKNLGLDVLFENKDFIVFNKLPFVIVQGAQDNENSLSYHLEYYKQKIGDLSDFNYFHVHRLDKETSGVLIVAKNIISLRDLNEIFKKKEVEKKYLCLVLNSFKEKKGTIEEIMRRNPDNNREKMSVVKTFKPGDKKSLSYYKVLKEFEFNNDIFSLVEIEIKTGIMHQIRVHMKSLGHPIVGDKMYGNSAINQQYEEYLNRQFLHAKSLKFNYKNKNYKIEAELTKDLKEFLEHIQT